MPEFRYLESTRPSAKPADVPVVVNVQDDQSISSWKLTAYNIAKLAPKLILSGVGWAVGFAIGGNLGAGVGDAAGAFLGCAVSFLVVELIFGKMFELDPELNEKSFTTLAVDRLKSALILSAGCFVGGLVFNTALTKVAVAALGVSGGILPSLGKALITGSITAVSFLAGTTTFRGIYTGLDRLGLMKGRFAPEEHHKISWKNLKTDIKTSFWIIFPAETAFVATSLPLFGATWLCGAKLAALKAGTAVLIGGVVGAFTQSLSDRVEKLVANAA